MKVTRHAVFETNSSSTHSISIAGDGECSDTLAVEGGICEVWEGEFGWEEETYNDAATKASYCLTFAKHNEHHLAMLRRVIQEHTGADEVRFMGDGYIDHQSSDVALEAFASDDTLAAFIFNPHSGLTTDNDNH